MGTPMPDKRRVRGARRLRIYMRDRGECYYCGSMPKSPQLDHVMPRKHGGTDDAWNLVTSCWLCNTRKNDKILDNTEAIWLELSQRPVTKGTVRTALTIVRAGWNMIDQYDAALDWVFLGMGPVY